MDTHKNPFYRPLWVRLLILAVCVAWTVFEWWHDETTWLVIALAVTAYSVWAFFLAYDPADSEKT